MENISRLVVGVVVLAVLFALLKYALRRSGNAQYAELF